MEWLKESITWAVELDDIALRQFFFYFIGSCLFGNKWLVLTCKLLGAIRVMLDIGANNWGPFLIGSLSLSLGRLHDVASRASRVADKF